MLKIENTEVTGWQAAIRGLRNPLNSWERSDTKYYDSDPIDGWELGDNDKDLMLRMNASTEQSKYRRMIIVTCDITAPLYWWKEADTYKVGTVRNSCSTMHKITSKEFTLDDFSHEKMVPFVRGRLSDVVRELNYLREVYYDFDRYPGIYTFFIDKKQVWDNIIQLLPSSYNQRATWQANYEVLAQIYRQRKNHKLMEWHEFNDWIRSLPYSELITGEVQK